LANSLLWAFASVFLSQTGVLFGGGITWAHSFRPNSRLNHWRVLRPPRYPSCTFQFASQLVPPPALPLPCFPSKAARRAQKERISFPTELIDGGLPWMVFFQRIQNKGNRFFPGARRNAYGQTTVPGTALGFRTRGPSIRFYLVLMQVLTLRFTGGPVFPKLCGRGRFFWAPNARFRGLRRSLYGAKFNLMLLSLEAGGTTGRFVDKNFENRRHENPRPFFKHPSKFRGDSISFGRQFNPKRPLGPVGFLPIQNEFSEEKQPRGKRGSPPRRFLGEK